MQMELPLQCIAIAMHLNVYTEGLMRTTTFPPLRVTPDLRRSAEAVLEEGETLSAFILESVERQIETRQARDLFIERGLASGDRARRAGKYVSSDAVLRRLRRRLEMAQAAPKPVPGKTANRAA